MSKRKKLAPLFSFFSFSFFDDDTTVFLNLNPLLIFLEKRNAETSITLLSLSLSRPNSVEINPRGRGSSRAPSHWSSSSNHHRLSATPPEAGAADFGLAAADAAMAVADGGGKKYEVAG